MKHLRILSVILSVSLLVSVAAGCKKEESEAPVLIYYSEGQSEPSAITFPAEEQAAPAATEGGEVLAPIIADRTSTETTAASETSLTVESETSQTTAASETQETTASETSATTAAGGQSADVPVVTSGTHVHDDAGVISDESSLNSAMASFESDTGISPAIFTISNQLSGDEFRQYARDIYSNNFSDQDHVLIVYQLTPAGTWSWTCVFGNNTGTVFTQDHIDEFQSNLTNAFSSGNVDNALVSTFNAAENYD